MLYVKQEEWDKYKPASFMQTNHPICPKKWDKLEKVQVNGVKKSQEKTVYVWDLD